MAEHEPSIGLSSGWLTPKPMFNGLGVTFDLDPAHPGWENPYGRRADASDLHRR